MPPAADLPRLKADPKLSVFSIQGLRVIFLYPDMSRPGEEPFITGNDGKPLAVNPLHDLHVRQALSLAINRTGLAERVMQGTAVATGQWLPPGAFGYAPDVGVPAYDPTKAKSAAGRGGLSRLGSR